MSLTAFAVSSAYLSPSTAFGPITAAGNCGAAAAATAAARASADGQLADFLTTAAKDSHSTALFPNDPVPVLGTAPYDLAIPDTDLTVSVALHNMTAADTSGATSTSAMSWGVASDTSPVLSTGSTERLQDCAPRPTRLVSAPAGPLATTTPYWNATGFGTTADRNSLDSTLFTFSEPVDNFGAWFGDLETRGADVGGVATGALAYVKLYDSTGAVLSVEPVIPNVQTPIVPAVTPFGCGGSSDNDTSACGNHGTRFVGFTWDTPSVAAFQVIVGDDDSCNEFPPAQCTGATERISLIGPTYAFSNPKLTLEKVVVNDNFGTATPADFTFELVADPNGVPLATTHSHGDIVDLQIGTEYAVREVASGDYTLVSSTCLTDEASTTDTVDVPVAAAGFTPTVGNSQFRCTLTNDDDPRSVPMTVTKTVINDEGGVAAPGDFELTVTVDGATTTLTSGATIDLTSDDEVTVGETPLAGYTLTSIECSDSANTPLGSSFTPSLALGTVTCVVTNDDVALASTPSPPTTAGRATAGPATSGPARRLGVELPATGGSTGGSMQLAFGALAAGLLLTTVSRRRRL